MIHKQYVQPKDSFLRSQRDICNNVGKNQVDVHICQLLFYAGDGIHCTNDLPHVDNRFNEFISPQKSHLVGNAEKLDRK